MNNLENEIMQKKYDIRKGNEKIQDLRQKIMNSFQTSSKYKEYINDLNKLINSLENNINKYTFEQVSETHTIHDILSENTSLSDKDKNKYMNSPIISKTNTHDTPLLTSLEDYFYSTSKLILN